MCIIFYPLPTILLIVLRLPRKPLLFCKMSDKKTTETKKNKVTLRQVFKTIIWPRRKLLLVGLVLIIISRLASLVLPWASKYLLDDIIPNKDLKGLNNLLWLVGFSIFVNAITSFILTKILSVEAQHLISKLRVQVQQKIISLPINYYDNTKSGALVSRIMTDVEGVRNLIGTGLVQLIGGTITSVLALIMMIMINPKMTFSVLLPVVIFAFIAMKAFSYIRPIFKKRGVINAEVTGRLTETLNGIRIIKAFNAETQETDTFAKGVERLFMNIKQSLTATSLVTSSATFLLGLAAVVIMGMGGYLMIEGKMSSGDFLAFNLYLGFMIAPIVQMSNIGSQLTEAFAGLDRTEEIMNTPPEEDSSIRTIKLKELKGDIRFDHVSFAYQEGKEVLNDITFQAPAGSVTALVGTSGSGKTTIAGLVATFLNPDAGTITLDGTDLSKVTLSSYRQHLGVVLQDDFLFEGTIRENILFPRPGASEADVLSAAKAAYVTEFTDRFDTGLDTLIGERGVKLSGGQRQRIAIARAILANPKIIILDEATSNLDTQSESMIQKSLAELMKGRTTFVIAHRLSTIRQASQILVIENGQIAERGTHEELISKKGRYFELHTYQARI
jgi:ABC-type multidrug transport system fused ATPase/permease subunit